VWGLRRVVETYHRECIAFELRVRSIHGTNYKKIWPVTSDLPVSREQSPRCEEWPHLRFVDISGIIWKVSGHAPKFIHVFLYL
jgi:hypothetical protein